MGLTLSNGLKESFQNTFKSGSGAITKLRVEGRLLDVEVYNFAPTNGNDVDLPAGFVAALPFTPNSQNSQDIRDQTEWYALKDDELQLASSGVVNISQAGFGASESPQWQFTGVFDGDLLWFINQDTLPGYLFAVDVTNNTYRNNTGGNVRIIYYKKTTQLTNTEERFQALSDPFVTPFENVTLGSLSATNGLGLASALNFTISNVKNGRFDQVLFSTDTTAQYTLKFPTAINKPVGSGILNLDTGTINFKGDGE